MKQFCGAKPAYMIEDYKKERGERLRKAAGDAGYSRPKDVIEKFKSRGVTMAYYQHQKGNIGFSFQSAQVYAEIFGVSAEWLYTGDGPMRDGGQLRMPIVGNVSAGVAHYLDDHEKGAGIDYMDQPDFSGRIVLRVIGDSMAPLARDGDYAIFGPRHDDPTPLIGQRVMAVTEAGDRLFKVLRKGTEPGTFSLFSLNSAYDAVENVRIQWALPLEWIKAN